MEPGDFYRLLTRRGLGVERVERYPEKPWYLIVHLCEPVEQGADFNAVERIRLMPEVVVAMEWDSPTVVWVRLADTGERKETRS